MSDFDFVFSLFGLLLGFSLVEVLRGLARVIEAQLRAVKLGPEARNGDKSDRPFRAGWLTPLLGLFVMLDVISFWGSAWVARGQLAYEGPVVLGGLIFTGSYYLAAHLVFPTDEPDWADLDAHYFRVRRAVFGTLIGLSLFQATWLASAVPGVAEAMRTPVVLTSALLLYGLMVAAMAVRGKRASTVVLVLLSLRYVFQYLS
jgi:hypothetical protein